MMVVYVLTGSTMVVYVLSSQEEHGVVPGAVYGSLEAAEAALRAAGQLGERERLVNHGEAHWATRDGRTFVDEHEVLGL